MVPTCESKVVLLREDWKLMSQQTQLVWAIKASLVEYISALEDGAITLSEAVTQDASGFIFPLDAQRSDFNSETLEGKLQFLGSVTFSGHWGMLNIEIRDPEISIQGTRGTLTVVVGCVLSPASALDFAELEFSSPGSTQDVKVMLTAGGMSLMGEQYSVGQELSPLRIAVAQS